MNPNSSQKPINDNSTGNSRHDSAGYGSSGRGQTYPRMRDGYSPQPRHPAPPPPPPANSQSSSASGPSDSYASSRSGDSQTSFPGRMNDRYRSQPGSSDPTMRGGHGPSGSFNHHSTGGYNRREPHSRYSNERYRPDSQYNAPRPPPMPGMQKPLPREPPSESVSPPMSSSSYGYYRRPSRPPPPRMLNRSESFPSSGGPSHFDKRAHDPHYRPVTPRPPPPISSQSNISSFAGSDERQSTNYREFGSKSTSPFGSPHHYSTQPRLNSQSQFPSPQKRGSVERISHTEMSSNSPKRPKYERNASFNSFTDLPKPLATKAKPSLLNPSKKDHYDFSYGREDHQKRFRDGEKDIDNRDDEDEAKSKFDNGGNVDEVGEDNGAVGKSEKPLSIAQVALMIDEIETEMTKCEEDLNSLRSRKDEILKAKKKKERMEKGVEDGTLEREVNGKEVEDEEDELLEVDIDDMSMEIDNMTQTNDEVSRISTLDSIENSSATDNTRKDTDFVSLHERIYAENKRRAEQSKMEKLLHFNTYKKLRNPSSDRPSSKRITSFDFKDIYPFIKENEEKHSRIRPLIVRRVQIRLYKQLDKEISLRREYYQHYQVWQKKIAKLEKQKEKRSRKVKDSEVSPPQVANPSASADAVRSNRVGLIARNRRSDGFTAGDIVRSEAEFAELLARLEAEHQMDNPDSKMNKGLAEIPDMITDSVERSSRIFHDTNRLVLDPVSHFTEIDLINPWTIEEEEVFLTKYMIYPKQFEKIASFLENKTTADVVKFYYRNKKNLELRKMIGDYKFKDRGGRRRTNPRKKTVTGSSQSAASLLDQNQAQANSLFFQHGVKTKELRDLEHMNRYWEPAPPGEGRRKPGATSQSDKSAKRKPKVPTGSNLQSEDDASDNEINPAAVTPLISQSASNNTPPSSAQQAARWSESERELALKAFEIYGKDFKSVAEYVGNKTEEHCRNFFHNYRRKYGIVVPSDDKSRRRKRKADEVGQGEMDEKRGPVAREDKRRRREKGFQKGGLRASESGQDVMEALVEPESQPMVHSVSVSSLPDDNLQEPLASSQQKRRKRGPKKKDRDSLVQILAEDAPTNLPPDASSANLSVSDTLALYDTSGKPTPEEDLLSMKQSGRRRRGKTKAVQSHAEGETQQTDGKGIKRPMSSYWSVAERTEFMKLFMEYGKSWDTISKLLETKSTTQVKNYYQNHKDRMSLDNILLERQKKIEEKMRNGGNGSIGMGQQQMSGYDDRHVRSMSQDSGQESTYSYSRNSSYTAYPQQHPESFGSQPPSSPKREEQERRQSMMNSISALLNAAEASESESGMSTANNSSSHLPNSNWYTTGSQSSFPPEQYPPQRYDSNYHPEQPPTQAPSSYQSRYVRTSESGGPLYSPTYSYPYQTSSYYAEYDRPGNHYYAYQNRRDVPISSNPAPGYPVPPSQLSSRYYPPPTSVAPTSQSFSPALAYPSNSVGAADVPVSSGAAIDEIRRQSSAYTPAPTSLVSGASSGPLYSGAEAVVGTLSTGGLYPGPSSGTVISISQDRYGREHTQTLSHYPPVSRDYPPSSSHFQPLPQPPTPTTNSYHSQVPSQSQYYHPPTSQSSVSHPYQHNTTQYDHSVSQTQSLSSQMHSASGSHSIASLINAMDNATSSSTPQEVSSPQDQHSYHNDEQESHGRSMHSLPASAQASPRSSLPVDNSSSTSPQGSVPVQVQVESSYADEVEAAEGLLSVFAGGHSGYSNPPSRASYSPETARGQTSMDESTIGWNDVDGDRGYFGHAGSAVGAYNSTSIDEVRSRSHSPSGSKSMRGSSIRSVLNQVEETDVAGEKEGEDEYKEDGVGMDIVTENSGALNSGQKEG